MDNENWKLIEEHKTQLSAAVKEIQTCAASLDKFIAAGDWGACYSILKDVIGKIPTVIWIAAWLYSHRDQK